MLLASFLLFHIFIFFSRTSGSISTNLGIKHSWVKGYLDCLNEGSCRFPMGDNSEISIKKILQNHLAPMAISTIPGTKHPCIKRTQDLAKKNPSILKKGTLIFFLISYSLGTALRTISQVSDVAYGPLDGNLHDL